MRSPQWIQNIFSSYTWRMKSVEKKVYLTFDDGPTPKITEWVLNLLKEDQIEATFFLIGDKIEKYSEIYKLLKASKHQIGNHTFNHLVGWKTSNSTYLNNVEKCQTYIETKLFRPPHGRIKPSQARILKKLGYQIIMWDVLSGDFDQSLDSNFILAKLKANTRNGSIVVFHDSEKAWDHLKIVLPKYIKWLKAEGFSFGTF